jgi:hypothetical protein
LKRYFGLQHGLVTSIQNFNISDFAYIEWPVKKCINIINFEPANFTRQVKVFVGVHKNFLLQGILAMKIKLFFAVLPAGQLFCAKALITKRTDNVSAIILFLIFIFKSLPVRFFIFV